MAYEAQSFAGFGAGLNLRDKADAVSEQECIDAMNVIFTERGAVKQRGGYSVFTDTALDGQGDTLYPHYESDGTKHLIVGDVATGQLTALNTSGAEVDIEASLSTGGCFGFARFGAPGNEYTYVGNGVDELWYYDGSTFTNVPDDGARVPPKGGALAVYPNSNRLVNARFTTTTGGPNGGSTNPSTIWFSDAGDPETWDDNNFIQLHPGDGESIQAIVAWREYLFVFKETKFFVFTGESQDAAGNPIFNFYTVDTGHGAVGPRAVSADEGGVYFLSRDGLMRTTGGEPEQLSDAISPIFEGGSADYFTGGELDHSVISLAAVNCFAEQVYVNYSTGGTANDRTLVYSPRDNWWSLWDIAAADMVSFRAGNREELFFTYPTGDNEVGRMQATDTNDATAAIESYWRSGWFDYGLPIVKRIRESKAWGSGIVKLGVSYDFEIATGTLTEIDFSDPTASTWGGTTWGGSTWASPAGLKAALRRVAVRGTAFSTSLYNNTLDNAWSVSRLDHHLVESRIPSITTAVASSS